MTNEPAPKGKDIASQKVVYFFMKVTPFGKNATPYTIGKKDSVPTISSMKKTLGACLRKPCKEIVCEVSAPKGETLRAIELYQKGEANIGRAIGLAYTRLRYLRASSKYGFQADKGLRISGSEMDGVF